jgi:uncharacterized protein YukE
MTRLNSLGSALLGVGMKHHGSMFGDDDFADDELDFDIHDIEPGDQAMPDDGAMEDIRKASLTPAQQESYRRQIEDEDAHNRAVERRNAGRPGETMNTRAPVRQPFTPMGAPAPAAAPTQAAPRARRMSLEKATTGIVSAPRRIFIYGDGGLGKSTFLAEAGLTLGGPTMFFDTQDGTANIGSASRFEPRPTAWQDLLDATDELLEKQHNYKLFAIDLVDDVEQMIFNHIVRRDSTAKSPKQNIEDYGFNKGPTIALVEWRQMLSKLERLRREKGMTIAFSGHAGVNKFKNPEGGDFGRYGPLINEKASALVRGWCDTVLFAREQMFTQTDEVKRTRGMSTGTRLIHTVGTASFYAKNRDGLPDTLSLDWCEFAAACEAGTPSTAGAIHEEIAKLRTRLDGEADTKFQAVMDWAGEDVNKLARALGKLRERTSEQTQMQQQEQAESEQ